ncbi:hypothetical protein D3C75_927340 [compost metagenome]
MISTFAPSSNLVFKSTALSLILPAIAFLRSPLLIDAATSSIVLPSAYSRTAPSGKEIDIATVVSSLIKFTFKQRSLYVSGKEQKKPVPERDELIYPWFHPHSALPNNRALNSALCNGNDPVSPNTVIQVRKHSYKGVNQNRNRREFQPSSLSLHNPFLWPMSLSTLLA